MVVELSGGLLDSREMLVKPVERLVPERAGLGDVGRNVLGSLGEPRDHKGGEDFVKRITKLDEVLAIIICLQGVDAISNSCLAFIVDFDEGDMELVAPRP
jgi:hypothetical protein